MGLDGNKPAVATTAYSLHFYQFMVYKYMKL